MGPFKALWCSDDQTSNKLAIKKFHGLYRKKLIRKKPFFKSPVYIQGLHANVSIFMPFSFQ